MRPCTTLIGKGTTTAMHETTTSAASERTAAPPSAMLDALAAAGPTPEYAQQLALFGQLVGIWDVDDTHFDATGAVTRQQRGEWLFGWVLNGRAIQDVLITPPRDVQRETGVPFGEYGTTLRFYDPMLDAWQVTFVAPVYGAIVQLVARPDEAGSGIVLEGRAPEGAPDASHHYRWTFSDITADAFRWRGYWSADEGQTWQVDEEMLAQRRTTRG
jgi:hypothetical protein